MSFEFKAKGDHTILTDTWQLETGRSSGEENQGKEVGEPKTRTKRARTDVQQAPTKG
jgi:hypothetical protein